MLCLGAGSIPVGSLNPKPNWYFLNYIITFVLHIIHTIMTGELQTPRAQFSLLPSKQYIITSQSSSHGMLCLGAGLIPVGSMNPKPNLYFRNHIITLVLDIIHTIMTGELQTPRAQFSLLTSKQVTGL